MPRLLPSKPIGFQKALNLGSSCTAMHRGLACCQRAETCRALVRWICARTRILHSHELVRVNTCLHNSGQTRHRAAGQRVFLERYNAVQRTEPEKDADQRGGRGARRRLKASWKPLTRRHSKLLGVGKLLVVNQTNAVSRRIPSCVPCQKHTSLSSSAAIRAEVISACLPQRRDGICCRYS